MGENHRGGVTLREVDVLAIAGMLGDFAVMTETLEEKRELLPRRLAHLMGAAHWLWARAEATSGNSFVLREVLGEGAIGPEQGVNTPGEKIRQRRIVELPQWHGEGFPQTAHGEMAPFPGEAGLPYMLSLHRGASGLSAVVFFRGANQPAFSERERKMVHAVLAGVPWLHRGIVSPETPFPPKKAELSPRLQDVLSLLQEGKPRKEVAERLGISLHTVHGYARDLYRRLGVHSQAELVYRFAEERRSVA